MSSGGHRPNSGRRADEGKRVTYTVRILPKTKETLQLMKAAGIKISQVLDDAAAAWSANNSPR